MARRKVTTKRRTRKRGKSFNSSALKNKNIAAIAVIVIVAAAIGIYSLLPPAQITGEATRFGLPLSVYRELPPMPENFLAVDVLVKSGKVTEMCTRIGEEYWKQPEFYPDFISGGAEMMLNPPVGRVGTHGYGAYPAEVISLVDLTGGQTSFKTCTFFRTSWFIERWQGLGLAPTYPNSMKMAENSFPDGSRYVEQDASENQGYFRIVVEPEYMLLEPTWGYFWYGWTQKAEVTVYVDPSTPPGNYIIGVNPTPPPKEKHEEWLWQYLTLYNPGGAFSIDRPFFSMGVVVS